MNLKPTRTKLIITFLALIISAVPYLFLECFCGSEKTGQGVDYGYLSIMNESCRCGYISLIDVVLQYIMLLIFPILIYVYISQEKKK